MGLAVVGKGGMMVSGGREGGKAWGRSERGMRLSRESISSEGEKRVRVCLQKGKEG